MDESEDTPRTVPDSVAALSDAQFRAWRHHPVSEVVLQYLRDYRAALLAEMQDRWLQGVTRIADEQEARGRALAVGELAELQLDAVRAFYGAEEDGGVDTDNGKD